MFSCLSATRDACLLHEVLRDMINEFAAQCADDGASSDEDDAASEGKDGE